MNLDNRRMKTFQHIYDFCRGDLTFRAYYDIPDRMKCPDRRTYRYYHGEVRDGQSRSGTFIYSQSRRQLERFLGTEQESIRLFFNIVTGYRIDPDRQFSSPGRITYVIAQIDGDGVRVRFTHPFKRGFEQQWIEFVARSHRPFDAEGLIGEITAYFRKNLLFAPGRYRDIQLANSVSKEDFPQWYRCEYRQATALRSAIDTAILHQRYPKKEKTSYSWEDCERILGYTGFFDDMNCCISERDDLIWQFMQLCNRPVRGEIL